MPVPLPPVSGTLWASLSFGGPFLKNYPQAASEGSKGLVQSDLEYGEQRAQQDLEPLMRQHYDKATVDGWTGTDIPSQIRMWADELAAAYTLHLASAGGRLDRKRSYKDWAMEVTMEVKAFLMAGGQILDGDGNMIEGRTGVERSAAGVRGPHVSSLGGTEVFDDTPLRDLVQFNGVPDRTYYGEEERPWQGQS